MSDRRPRYTHDCNECIYLGDYTHDAKAVDLYYCAQPRLGRPTVIARFSSEPNDYSSGMYSAPACPELAEAMMRVLHRGLIT